MKFIYNKIETLQNKNIKKFSFLLLFSFFILVSCQDQAPTEYVPNYVIQALLIVNYPIQNINVLLTQSLRDSFIVENQYVRDANIQITGDNRVMTLSLDPKTNNSYFYSDTTYKVKPNTQYKIQITLSDGKVITGQTYTPTPFNWINKAGKFLQYPKSLGADTNKQKISWQKSDTTQIYLLSVIPIDTLNYGMYLTPPTDEKNERIITSFNKNQKYFFRELSNWTFLPTTETPVVMTIFKWYGYQEVNVYAPDNNFLKWALQMLVSRDLNPQLSTINGAFGYFGSAAMIRDTTFLLKYKE